MASLLMMKKKLGALRASAMPVWCLVFLSACGAGANLIPTSGPSESQITAQQDATPSITVLDVNDSIAQHVLTAQKHGNFSDTFKAEEGASYVVGPGDTLEVTVWEAPPATLFGMKSARSEMTTVQATTFPEQMVTADGNIHIPFAGIIAATGKTTQQIEESIVKKLTGKANQPQVFVKVTHNVTSNVTIVGEVAQSVRMPLTPKGERLLDALAAAGGVRQSVDKMTVQISREGKVLAMPLDAVIQDPAQNVSLKAGDVITAMNQPFSFTALGATGKNQEVNFEAKGISLAQALGRIGGVDDSRANAQGVFIFRFEDPMTFEIPMASEPSDFHKIPVVYRVDLTDPHTFLIAQNFPIRDKDVLYVANAPVAELQKFLNLLYTSVFSVVTIKNN